MQRRTSDQVVAVDSAGTSLVVPSIDEGTDEAARHRQGVAVTLTFTYDCGVEGLSIRWSGYRANRPASGACTGSLLSHGQPPKPVRR